jgi:hypothetical protein
MSKKKNVRIHNVPKNKKSKIKVSLKIKKLYRKKITFKIEEPKIKQVKLVEAGSLPVKVRKTRRKKSPGVIYFSQDTEDAIIEFNKIDDHDRREDLYNGRIKYPFDKLVENIFNTFKFSYFETGPLEVQRETVAHLVANIHKFEAGKGKAFSYFSIIAKHYLIALNNSTYKRFNQHVDISEERDENTVQLQSEDKHYKEAEMQEFMKLMVTFWENNVGKIFTKQRDLDIANAVIELFRRSDRIDAFNKKALYLYIREISNCKTQQITKVINKMKQYQSNISRSYINSGYINTDSYMKV